jgi:hypothetical protein
VKLEAHQVNAITKAKENKATADKYGERLIDFEGGQHIVPNELAAQNEVYTAMQRNPRIGLLYERYLAHWEGISPDLFTVYSATGSISQHGALGIREYAGQPISEAPKRREVRRAVAARYHLLARRCFGLGLQRFRICYFLCSLLRFGAT